MSARIRRTRALVHELLPTVLALGLVLTLGFCGVQEAFAQAHQQHSMHTFTIGDSTTDADIDSIVEVLEGVVKEDFLVVLSTRTLSRLTGYGQALMTPEGSLRMFQFLRTECSRENPCVLLIDRAGKHS